MFQEKKPLMKAIHTHRLSDFKFEIVCFVSEKNVIRCAAKFELFTVYKCMSVLKLHTNMWPIMKY